MNNLMTITQYAKHKNVAVGTVHYWIKKKYLHYTIIAGIKFIDINSEPIKKMI